MVNESNASLDTPIISLYTDKTISGFKVFPIPATTTINIAMVATVAIASKVVAIWDHSGQVLKRLKFNTISGFNLFTIPVTGFSPGVYILQNGDKVTSFIKL